MVFYYLVLWGLGREKKRREKKGEKRKEEKRKERKERRGKEEEWVIRLSSMYAYG
jgi:hypothetical protein